MDLGHGAWAWAWAWAWEPELGLQPWQAGMRLGRGWNEAEAQGSNLENLKQFGIIVHSFAS